MYTVGQEQEEKWAELMALNFLNELKKLKS